MTNTLNKVIHNGDEYEFPGGISNITTGTTSTVSGIRVWTDAEYGLITPEEWQISIVYSGGGGWWRLPAEYQEVEWIQASWDCCVEIGWYTLSWYQKIETKFNTATLASSWQVPFFWGNVPSWQNYLTCKLPDIDQFQIWIGDADLYIGSLATNTDYTIVQTADNGNLTMEINWTTYTDTYTGSPIATHMPLFCRWRDASQQYSYYATDMKLYYFKVYNTSADCVRDLVPCYRIADDVVGMYDLVNDVFYTNDWTWTFTKWPDVN